MTTSRPSSFGFADKWAAAILGGLAFGLHLCLISTLRKSDFRLHKRTTPRSR